jgi:8-amino-7-oxononanoate synthase
MKNEKARFHASLTRALEHRAGEGLLRTVSVGEGVDLTSNDYLGYRQDPGMSAAVASWIMAHGVGAGASRLLGGHDPSFEALESRLAVFSGQSAALLFPSGFQLNVGLMSALARREDTIISDAANHASLIDGIRLSAAHRVVTPHGDVDAVSRAVADAREARPDGRVFMVTESLFSMDGDEAPLVSLSKVAAREGALLVVDEAHATGLYGTRGSGLVEAYGLTDEVLCTVHTGGKALGVGGAWVAGDHVLVDTLVNHCRAFIYSTAPVPAIVGGLNAALERRVNDGERVEALHARASDFRAHLQALGLDVPAGCSPIVPVLLGEPEAATRVATALQLDGFDVRAVRPPTVPAGTSRLRIVVRSLLTDAQLQRLADRLAFHVRAEEAV